MEKVIVTGGLGYIGSHTVVALQEQGFEVIVADNLSNSSIDVLGKIKSITGKQPSFENIDLKDKQAVKRLFEKYDDVANIIHFAASKSVEESVGQPLKYYDNNITPLLYILQELQEKESPNFIFSSSCTVYGQVLAMPIKEDAPVMPAASPYGNTKKIGEELIADVTKATGLNAVLLRYFNPVGAHPSFKIGELPLGKPQNLVPFMTHAAIGMHDKLSVYGNDYPTPDGTCIRDYIHVVDLAKAHVISLQRLISKQNAEKCEVFNLGTGKGSSVLDVITTFEKVNCIQLKYEIAGRRNGDIIEAYADTEKVKEVLGWEAKLGLDTMLQSAWQWQLALEDQKSTLPI